MKKNIILWLCAVLLATQLVSALEFPESFSNSTFTRRVSMSVFENTGIAQEDIPIRVFLPLLSGMQSDFDDVRFVNSTHNGAFYYWIENLHTGVNATFWVRIPRLTASQNLAAFVYYGNTTVANQSNGNKTFTFFDDFDDASISGEYNTFTNTGGGATDPNITESGGLMNLSFIATGAGESKVATVLLPRFRGENYTTGGRVRSLGDQDVVRALGFIENKLGVPLVNGTYWGQSASNAGQFVSRNYTGSFTGTNIVGSGADSNSKFINVIVRFLSPNSMEFSADSPTFDYRFGQSENNFTNINISHQGFRLRSGANEGAASLLVDWFFVANSTNPQVNYTLSLSSATIHSPESGSFKNGNVLLNVTGTVNAEQSSFAQMNYSIDGAANVTLCTNCVVGTTTLSGLTDGSHTIVVYLSNSSITESGGIVSASTTFTYDNAKPTINIRHPHIEGNLSAIRLRFSQFDGLSGVSTCWYAIDNGANSSISCASNDTLISIGGQYGSRTISMNINDTANNINSSSRNFVVIEKTQDTFVQNVVENTTQTFTMSINDSTGLNPSVILTYDGVNYSATQSGVSGTIRTYQRTLNTGNVSFASIQNKEFNWTITGVLNGEAGGYTYNSNSQSVSALILVPTNDTLARICNTTATTVFTVNYTFVDELTGLNVINQNLTARYELWVGDEESKTVVAWKESHSNVSMYPHCLSPTSSNVSSNAMLVFGEGAYAPRQFNLLDAILNNITQTYNLYLLDDLEATSITITITDDNDIALPGYLVEAHKFRPEHDDFLLVESKITDPEGIVVLSLKVGDGEMYKFIIRDEDGTIVRVIDPFEVTATAYTFKITPESFTGLEQYNILQSQLVYSLVWNENTFNVTASWDDSETNLISLGCLRVDIRRGYGEDNELYNTCSSNDTGSLQYNIGNGTDEYRATFYVRSSIDGDEYIIEVLSIDLRTGWQNFGKEGVFWVFILVLTFSVMLATVPILMILMNALILFISWKLQLIGVTGTTVTVIMIIAIYFVVRMIRE